VVAAVAAERRAGAVEDGRPRGREAAVTAQEAALALAGEEAEVLALGLAGDREAVAAAISRTSALVSSVSGKASRPSSSGGSAASM
jgi:hypothetical protein